MNREPSPTVLVSGYALAPKGTAVAEHSRMVGVILEIDRSTDTVVDAAFTMVTELGDSFCKKLVVGYDVKQGIEPLVQVFSKALLVPSQPALAMALRSALQRYVERSDRHKQTAVDIGSSQ